MIATDAHRQANPYLSNAYTNYNKSDVRVAKTDYVQLRDISLSYTVPKSFVDRLRLSSPLSQTSGLQCGTPLC